jgi:hypothetical protein
MSLRDQPSETTKVFNKTIKIDFISLFIASLINGIVTAHTVWS